MSPIESVVSRRARPHPRISEFLSMGAVELLRGAQRRHRKDHRVGNGRELGVGARRVRAFDLQLNILDGEVHQRPKTCRILDDARDVRVPGEDVAVTAPGEAFSWDTVDGSLGGSGRSRNINPIGMTKGSKGIEPESFWRRLQKKWDAMAREEARIDVEFCEDAELVVVAFGTMARFVRFAVQELRDEGLRVGYARPITLWPFPSAALIEATQGAKQVAVLEQNAGQMIDDVRLAVLGSAPVIPIGGISSDEAGFGLGPLLDPDVIRERIRSAYNGEEVEL